MTTRCINSRSLSLSLSLESNSAALVAAVFVDVIFCTKTAKQRENCSRVQFLAGRRAPHAVQSPQLPYGSRGRRLFTAHTSSISRELSRRVSACCGRTWLLRGGNASQPSSSSNPLRINRFSRRQAAAAAVVSMLVVPPSVEYRKFPLPEHSALSTLPPTLT